MVTLHLDAPGRSSTSAEATEVRGRNAGTCHKTNGGITGGRKHRSGSARERNEGRGGMGSKERTKSVQGKEGQPPREEVHNWKTRIIVHTSNNDHDGSRR